MIHIALKVGGSQKNAPAARAESARGILREGEGGLAGQQVSIREVAGDSEGGWPTSPLHQRGG